MIRVRVELDVHGLGKRIIPLGTMYITNDGTGDQIAGNYNVRMESKTGRAMARSGRVEGHRRLQQPIWNLVWKALMAAGYSRT